MIRGRRTVLAGAAIAVALSGGTAWAATGGLSAIAPARPHVSDAVEESTSSTGVTDTTVGASTSTSTDTTDTTVAQSTTTVASTTTVPETTTSIAVTTPTTAPRCKPGWGYGDTNHCHSGPPGLAHRHGHGRP